MFGEFAPYWAWWQKNWEWIQPWNTLLQNLKPSSSKDKEMHMLSFQIRIQVLQQIPGWEAEELQVAVKAELLCCGHGWHCTVGMEHQHGAHLAGRLAGLYPSDTLSTKLNKALSELLCRSSSGWDRFSANGTSWVKCCPFVHGCLLCIHRQDFLIHFKYLSFCPWTVHRLGDCF